ncbi:MAG: 3-deoxy-D-manno-octulosonic acid transferase [Ignavibacteriota bacterium]|nr:3-deoxy-D-manno-octulosonic acid transferase [Ignavibacteriota bacterium]QKJ97852.1 MAG: 3-deoxy-D-manno-octulosonic acid transferase [Ignavibacteriota bacterium]GIK61515.1 MAG: 3-deoxy-D-manno-octulosonic acid transferase [Ignavibacteriota bacterium]GJQ40658.1 MAG: 3-deoxy-D-manno-octulosonic acid transferase [Ignavibacteriaceae bacterium]
MKRFWQILYNICFIPLLYLSLIAISLLNKKVRIGIAGRKRIFEDLILNRLSFNPAKKVIWFHSSSLGEFEQAKPIIEKLKKETDVNIVVSFFSPSGYENSKKYPYADIITYMPFDSKWRAKRFIDIVSPNMAVFMRYDIWPNHVWTLKEKKIPCLLVDATMKKNSARKFPLAKSFHKYLFEDFAKILTVSSEDADGFASFKCKNVQVKVVGDTRFDRVYNRSLASKNSKIIRQEILGNKNVLVAGSTWQQDEDVLVPVFLKLMKYDNNAMMIIAPHEPSLLRLEKLENEFSGQTSFIRLSHINNYNGEKIIIVDSIGVLSILYNYADAAFIGGSFKINVHNVLEAAVYGIPVLFGPKIENSQEAKNLVDAGGGFLINNKMEFYRELRKLFTNEQLLKKYGQNSLEFVNKHLGATDRIIKEIFGR